MTYMSSAEKQAADELLCPLPHRAAFGLNHRGVCSSINAPTDFSLFLQQTRLHCRLYYARCLHSPGRLQNRTSARPELAACRARRCPPEKTATQRSPSNKKAVSEDQRDRPLRPAEHTRRRRDGRRIDIDFSGMFVRHNCRVDRRNIKPELWSRVIFHDHCGRTA